MARIPVIAVFDAGKTNKKVLLFDEFYNVVHAQSTRLADTTDEDGYPCEDVHALSAWIHESLRSLMNSPDFTVKAVNFTSYGASFVHVDKNLAPILPLYNYLKPYPSIIKSKFFQDYGGELKISRETASPILDHLNSGLLLYRLKHENKFPQTGGYSLHLPQYLSALLTNKPFSDITSIGCHTILWNFDTGEYHEWVEAEQLSERLAPIFASDSALEVKLYGESLRCGIGLHDSSSALIPYLATFHEPFVLVSTGTWSISMNPFNESILTADELKHDCLCYLTYKGKPVKSSRLFAGHMHEEGVKRLNDYFSADEHYFGSMQFDEQHINKIDDAKGFDEINLANYSSFESAYHALIAGIIDKQVFSLNLVLSDNVKMIFVDGGFSKNDCYMKLLARAYPDHKVFAASVAQSTAMGAALAIHHHWNTQPVRSDVVGLVAY